MNLYLILLYIVPIFYYLKTKLKFMKKLFFLVSISTILLGSCNKERLITENDQIDLSAKVMSRANENFKFKLSSEEIKALDEKFLKETIQKFNGTVLRPGQCPLMLDGNAHIVEIESCDIPNFSNVTFRWRVLEREAYSGTLNYSFQLISGGLTQAVNPLEVSTSYPDCDETYDWCTIYRIFEITISIPNNDISNFWGGTISAVCSQSGSVLNTITLPTSSYGYTQNDYITGDARVFVNSGTSWAFISTECGLVCTPSFVICASSATFKYKKTSESNWIIVPFNVYTGIILNSLPQSIYDFESSLNYNFSGNSYTVFKNGTFSTF